MINKNNILQGSAANFLEAYKVGLLLASQRQKNNNVDLAFFDSSLQSSGAKAQLNILKKKINVNKVKIIALKRHESLGYFRHYPASNADWSSSIYQHENNNYLKSLPLLDKNILKLIKSYFNFFMPSEKFLDYNSKGVDTKKSIRIRFLRTSLRNIFIGKAYFKHTNSKVIITIHLFNLQIKYWIKQRYASYKRYIRKSEAKDYADYTYKMIAVIRSIFKNIKELKSLAAERYKNKKKIKSLAANFIRQHKNKENLKKIRTLLFKHRKFLKKIRGDLIKKIDYNKFAYKQDKKWIGISFHSHGNKKLRNKEFKWCDENYKPKISLYKRLFYACKSYKIAYLEFKKAIYELGIATKEKEWSWFLYMWITNLVYAYSNLKFEKYIPKLKKLISKIYKKKVEINIVILKYMYLNSDILSQAIALKLRDRNNRVWRVLRSCLSMVHIGGRNKILLPVQGLTNKVRLRREKSLAKRGVSLLDKIKNLELRRSAESFISQLNKGLRLGVVQSTASVKTSTFASKEISCFACPSFINKKGIANRRKQALTSLARDRRNNLNVLLAPSPKIKGLLWEASRLYSIAIAKGKILYFPFIKKTILIRKAFALHRNNNDILNHLIFGIFPLAVAPPRRRERKPKGKFKNWAFYFKNSLKYKVLRGVRLEAKGRLTRRFTASRSIFKLKWKGGLKNLDSSFRGLSASILRGHVKANVQYTLVSSKNRIGAYGIKGWVGGK